MARLTMAILAAGLLTACAPSGPETAAGNAADATCTAQGDATYHALDQDQLARTSQAGLLFAPMPNHVFDAEQLGALHVRDSQISDCERNGTAAASTRPTDNMPLGSGNIVTPHIIQSP